MYEVGLGKRRAARVECASGGLTGRPQAIEEILRGSESFLARRVTSPVRVGGEAQLLGDRSGPLSCRGVVRPSMMSRSSAARSSADGRSRQSKTLSQLGSLSGTTR